MIILASKSPRRQELLKLITEDFVVKSASVDEALPSGIEPCEAVLYLSRIKAEPFKSENDIGYLKYLGMIGRIEEGECDIKEYPKLDVPYDFSNERSMLIQCIQRNTLDDIIKYKIAFNKCVE